MITAMVYISKAFTSCYCFPSRKCLSRISDALTYYAEPVVMDQLQLERALRAIHEEQAQVQSSSQTKLAEASALVDGIEEKSLVIDNRLHDAEAKLAEVNRKSAALDVKLREVETRESLLQKERLSVVAEYVLFFIL